MPKHGPWRARVTFGPVAGRQIHDMTTAETIAADRVIVFLQTNPDAGDLIPGHQPLREYSEPGTDVRVLYHHTTGGGIYVDYIEA